MKKTLYKVEILKSTSVAKTLMDPDGDTDSDFFVIDVQDVNKKWLMLIIFWWQKVPEPDPRPDPYPYLWPMDPDTDPGGPKNINITDPDPQHWSWYK